MSLFTYLFKILLIITVAKKYLLNIDTIHLIKSATVAIGLVEKGQVYPKVIVGSGCLIDPAGYVLTATHVAEKCVELARKHNAAGDPVEMASFRSIIKDKIIFTADRIERFTALDLTKPPEDYVGPEELDITCGKPITKHTNLPFLPIKKICEYALGEEIAICGYPRGQHSLSLSTTKVTGMRFSPIMQFGKITGLMPWDNDELPYGLQTDVIGTGGSSGSPIIDMNGEIVGVAQNVIPSTVGNEKDEVIGYSKIGLTYGVTSCIFLNFVNKTKKQYETGIDEPAVVPMTTLKFVNFQKEIS